NEKWAHAVRIAPFRIARAPVTNEGFARFVDDGGDERDDLWTEEGRAWRTQTGARAPGYWQRHGSEGRGGGAGRVEAVAAHHPIVFVNWYEADAFCRWAGRRLPTEAEWELAATSFDGRGFPWGDEAPTVARANLDARAGGTVDVAAHADGDSPYGCRQMIGN